MYIWQTTWGQLLSSSNESCVTDPIAPLFRSKHQRRFGHRMYKLLNICQKRAFHKSFPRAVLWWLGRDPDQLYCSTWRSKDWRERGIACRWGRNIINVLAKSFMPHLYPVTSFFIKYHQFMRGHNLASPPSRRMEINNLDPVEGHLGPASVHSPFIEHFLVNPSENWFFRLQIADDHGGDGIGEPPDLELLDDDPTMKGQSPRWPWLVFKTL